MKLNLSPRYHSLGIGPEMVKNTYGKGSRAVENDPRDAEVVGQVVGPAEEEIREDGHRGVVVGLEPLDYWVLELREGYNHRNVAGVAEILDVFDAGGD